MRKQPSKLTFILLPLLILLLAPSVVSATSRYNSWQTIIVPDVCSFQIPQTMEVQGGAYKKYGDIYSREKGIVTDSNDVVIQQKGLNSINKTALRNKYVRILVNFTPINENYPRLGEPLRLSKADIRDWDDLFRQLCRKTEREHPEFLQVLTWDPTRVTYVNGIECLYYGYRRKGFNGAPPVIVKTYVFFNRDRIHVVTMSYREAEASFWKADLEKVIKTFEFVRR